MCMVYQPSELSAICGVNIPEPKFHMAQNVIASYFCDDHLDREYYGHLIQAEANVVGLFWDNVAGSWSYFLFVNQPCWFWGYEFSQAPVLGFELEALK